MRLPLLLFSTAIFSSVVFSSSAGIADVTKDVAANVTTDGTTNGTGTNDTATASPPVRVIPWRGFVLFENGELNRLEASGRTVPLHFRDPLYEGDRVELNPRRGRIVKLQFREGCLVALYAEREKAVLSPPLEGELWKFRAEALRAIAPTSAACEFLYKGAKVSLAANSEVFFDGARLLAPRGTVQASPLQTPLANDAVYQFDARHRNWEKTAEKTPYEFHDVRKLMAESTRIPEPPSTPWIRVGFGPEFGGSDTTFDQSYLDSRNNSAEGVRVQVQKRWGERSLIAMLHYRNNDRESNGPTPPNSSRIRSDFFGGEVGMRFSHERWWSPFVRVGFGREQPRTEVSYPSQSYYRSERLEFHSLSAAFGMDSILTPRNLGWLAVYSSAEVHLTKSIARGAKENLSTSGANSSASGDFTNEPWSVSTFGLIVHLGLMIQFY